MTKARTATSLIAMAAGAMFAMGASAEVPEEGASVDAAAVQELTAAIGSVEQTYGGKIESIELERRGDRTHYDVELRDENGQEWDLDIDASSGAVLDRAKDD